jgi:hypothetical protein
MHFGIIEYVQFAVLALFIAVVIAKLRNKNFIGSDKIFFVDRLTQHVLETSENNQVVARKARRLISFGMIGVLLLVPIFIYSHVLNTNGWFKLLFIFFYFALFQLLQVGNRLHDSEQLPEEDKEKVVNKPLAKLVFWLVYVPVGLAILFIVGVIMIGIITKIAHLFS